MPHDLLVFQHQDSHDIPVRPPRPQRVQTHFPSAEVQRERLVPQLQRLTEAFARHHAELQRDLQGLNPESVIVFEVAEGVDNFMNAVRRAGMEWLGDWDITNDADDDFYIDDERSKKIPEKLYFTMSDQRAMEQLLHLWNHYQEGDDAFEYGYGAFRKVFDQLRTVRFWNAQDRFYDIGMVEKWENALRNNAATIRFEIEFWYRDETAKREAAQREIIRILEENGGSVICVSQHPEIAYHGMIAECPSRVIRALMDNPENPLFNANQVMWIRATGQAIVHSELSESTEFGQPMQVAQLDAPVIALFDGLPLAGHTLLNNRMDINDADAYEDQYPVNFRIHGTEMASVILHGDLNHPLSPLHSRLYVRVVMKPNVMGDESIPDDKLLVDVLHQAVMEIVDNPALRESIRIVNISIGDFDRPFAHTISPAAKMLDYLSERYNLLFLISSGNDSDVLDLPMTYGDYNQLNQQDRYKAVYQYLWNEQADLRILSPAESMNSVTVGAISQDNSASTPIADILDVVPLGCVTSYSRFGGGYGRSIKPDLLNKGGRLFYSFLGTNQSAARFRPSCPRIADGPGIKTAVPSNGLTGTAYSSGTSQATAYTSRMCADFLDVLRAIPGLTIPTEYEAIAIKSMLVHSCSWHYMASDIRQYIPVSSRNSRKEALRWIGYGTPCPEVSLFCTDQRATLIGYESLSPGCQVDMLFPLPPCLISQNVKRRLTITLAWMSPVAANRKSYRIAKLEFKPSNNPLMDEKRQDSDANTSRRGTVQHEVYEDGSAKMYQANDNLAITVLCHKDPLLRHSVKFVLMATLEVEETTNYPIYQEVAARLQNPMHVGIV